MGRVPYTKWLVRCPLVEGVSKDASEVIVTRRPGGCRDTTVTPDRPTRPTDRPTDRTSHKVRGELFFPPGPKSLNLCIPLMSHQGGCKDKKLGYG